jgi:hypothetical protein
MWLGIGILAVLGFGAWLQTEKNHAEDLARKDPVVIEPPAAPKPVTKRVNGKTYTFKQLKWYGFYNKDESIFFQEGLGVRNWFKITATVKTLATSTTMDLTARLHRVDGPAVEHSDGYKEYYILGEQLTYRQWLRKTGQDVVKKPQTN